MRKGTAVGVKQKNSVTVSGAATALGHTAFNIKKQHGSRRTSWQNVNNKDAKKIDYYSSYIARITSMKKIVLSTSQNDARKNTQYAMQ